MTTDAAASPPAARPSGVRLLPSEGVEGKPVSLWRTAWRRLFQRRSAMVGLGILALLIGLAIFAPWIAPYDPQEILIGREDVGARDPACIHLLGCPADQPQRLMGVLLAFPALLLAIAIVAVLGPGLLNALIAIAIVSIPIYARVMRDSVLSTRESDYVSASRALGADTFTILFRVVLPNAMTPLIVIGTLGIATAILDAAALSFLGLGAQPPTPEWGSMLGK